MILHFNVHFSVPVSLQPKKRTWSAIKQVSVFRKLPKVDQLLLQECSHEIIHSVALWHQIFHRLNKTRYSMITQRFRASLAELCYAWMYSGLLPPIFFCLISSPVQHSYVASYSYIASGFNFLIKTVAKKAKIKFFMVNINYTLFDSTQMCARLHAVVLHRLWGWGAWSVKS